MLFTNLLLASSCACAVGSGLALKTQPKNLSYNDENYSITLSVEDYTNNAYETFFDFLMSLNNDDALSNITYDYYVENVTIIDNTFSYEEYDNGAIQVFNGSGVRIAHLDNPNVDYKIEFTFNPKVDITFFSTSDYYSDLKACFIASPSVVDSVFDAVSDTTNGFVSALSNGLNGVVNLVYDTSENQFTIAGILMLIGVAVGLVFGIFRFVRALVKGVGN